MSNISQKKIFFSIAGIVALIITWIFLFGWVSLNTEGFLAPYDTALPTERPVTGTLESSVNNFFETSPGAELPAIIFILICIIIYVIRYVKEKNSANYQLHWELAAINGLFLMASIILILIINAIVCRPLCAIGFNWSTIIAFVLLTIIFFYIEYKGIFSLFRKNRHRGVA